VANTTSAHDAIFTYLRRPARAPRFSHRDALKLLLFFLLCWAYLVVSTWDYEVEKSLHKKFLTNTDNGVVSTPGNPFLFQLKNPPVAADGLQ